MFKYLKYISKLLILEFCIDTEDLGPDLEIEENAVQEDLRHLHDHHQEHTTGQNMDHIVDRG